jgi:hypothetical protein
VDDHVAEVLEDPAPVVEALDPELPDAEFFKDLAQLFRDRARLPLVRGGADDEVVRDRGQLADVEDDDVGGFLVVAGLGAGDGDLAWSGDGLPPEFQGETGTGKGVANGLRAVKLHHPRKKMNVTTTKSGTRMPTDQSM